MEENLKKALEDVFEAETDIFVSQLDEPSHEFSERYKSSVNKLLKRRRKSYYPLISTVGKRMTTVAAAIAVVTYCSVFTVSSVKESLYEIDQSEYEEFFYHVSIDKDVAKYYPTVIEEEYTLSGIPSDYEETICQKSEKKIRLVYQNKAKNYIIFYQHTKAVFNSGFIYDNEEIFTDENDQQYICYSLDETKVLNDSTFYWDNGQYIFEVSSDMDKEQLFELCKTLEKS